jgi:hypothetical protein
MNAASQPGFAQRFAQGLLNHDMSPPADLIAWNGSDPAKRYAVYRNNVVVSLINALADGHPVVQQLVGEAFFRAMAGVFVRAHPPSSPVMAWYGKGFADFIAEFPPVAHLPYLADVARLEWFRQEAWHSEDCTALSAEDFAKSITPALVEPERLTQTTLGLHPALRVLISAHPAVSIWHAHQGDNADINWDDIDLSQAEAALIVRPALDPLIIPLSQSLAMCIIRIRQGYSLAQALTNGTEAADLFNRLIHHQLIIKVFP